MGLRASTSGRAALHSGLKLARLLELSEEEFEDGVVEAEKSPLFARLREAGVLSIEPYAGAQLASRRFPGLRLRAAPESVGDLLDGQGEVVALIRAIGQKRFEECFLAADALSDQARAKACGITAAQAKRLREFLDRAYIQQEFEAPAPAPRELPEDTSSAVAGIEVDGGKPVLGFFNREIWKGRYRVDDARRILLKQSLSPDQYAKLERFLSRLEFLEKRKSSLFRVLEAVVEAQAEFLRSGDPEKRRPLTQRSVAADLDILPSALNRLIARKSVQLPWGLEAPLSEFFPSSKKLLRDKLFDLAREHPSLSDEKLRAECKRLFGVDLSRRSIAQYRKELGLPGRTQRGQTLTNRTNRTIDAA